MTSKGNTKKKPPVVSVVIPTFNRAGLVAEAIDSVLGQKRDDYELIVVDDGSSDGTTDVLGVYNDRIMIIRQDNRGVSAARNAGIVAARGHLIAFLDSDDLWLPGKLSRQIEFFTKNPGARICQTEELWIRNGIRVNPRARHRKPDGDIYFQSLALCLVSPSAVMIRRDLFDEVGLFNESLPACEDYDMWLRIGCRHPVFLIDAPLIVKRGGHPDQLSKMPGLDKFRIQSLAKLIESGILSTTQQHAAIDMLETKCRIYVQGCLKRGKETAAEYYISLPERFGR